MVWKDYRITAPMMDSQTRQMELVVQSPPTALSFRWRKVPRPPGLRGCQRWKQTRTISPTLAPSDTILGDIWLEDNNGNIVYRCYGITALSDVLITRSEGVSYWQYHRGDTHYLVLKKSGGGAERLPGGGFYRPLQAAGLRISGWAPMAM